MASLVLWFSANSSSPAAQKSRAFYEQDHRWECGAVCTPVAFNRGLHQKQLGAVRVICWDTPLPASAFLLREAWGGASQVILLVWAPYLEKKHGLSHIELKIWGSAKSPKKFGHRSLKTIKIRFQNDGRVGVCYTDMIPGPNWNCN